MDNARYVLTVLLVITAINLLLSLLQNLINGRKLRRVRHVPLIPGSFVLAAAGCGLMIYYYEKLFAIYNELAILRGIINADIVVINIVLLAAFVLVKLIVRPIVVALCKDESLLEKFSYGFYWFDDFYGEWFLMEKWVKFRKFFLTVYIASIVAGSIVISITMIKGPYSKLYFLSVPAVMMIVLGEMYGYINGQTKEEFEHSIMGDNSVSKRIHNYFKLRPVLEKIFEEPLISANSGNEFVGRETPVDLMKEMAESEDKIDKVVADFFQINDRYKNAEVDYFDATRKMMHRQNIIFNNPFYKDLETYITLPLSASLLSKKNVVVLCGRQSVAEDVKEWLHNLLAGYSHIDSLWRVGFFSEQDPSFEVGILTFTQIYDKNVLNVNKEFLKQADFCLIIEPSVMLNTSQVALSILGNEMATNGKPVYCVCDRSSDGLVDTLSHVLRSEFVEVVAMPVPRCSYTGMTWDADGDFKRQELFDKQTRYLGNGVELAAVAVRNQVSSARWYSESKIPLRDVKWITGQSYATICRYMNTPVQQTSIYDKIEFIPNLWSASQEKEQFIIVEDEFCNLYSMMRVFLSRGTDQSFINVMSENYLLRDYMRCNKQLFIANPHAVPSFVPDYAKTERNTLLKLLIMMSMHQVSESEIAAEFRLAGIDDSDIPTKLSELLRTYTFASDKIIKPTNEKSEIDELGIFTTNFYSISDEDFDSNFEDTLKNAYYVIEDEVDEKSYIDAKLFSHVTQTILPGQYVTYDGKYYVAKYVAPSSGVILRRPSDLFEGRKYYRQIRKYNILKAAPDMTPVFEGVYSDDRVVSCKTITDIEYAVYKTDFSVDTTGYLELNDNHDLRTARVVDFKKDPSANNYTRKYKNKSVLRIKLPGADVNVRFTLSLLLNEVFRSVYPDAWQYITVVSKQPEKIEGVLNYVVYPIEGEYDDDYIYVLEDSDIDLGLLESVEKNFTKFMEIVTDFLQWHFEKMREPEAKDPVSKEMKLREFEAKKKRGPFAKLMAGLRKILRLKPKEEEKVKIVVSDGAIDSTDPVIPASNTDTSEKKPEGSGFTGEIKKPEDDKTSEDPADNDEGTSEVSDEEPKQEVPVDLKEEDDASVSSDEEDEIAEEDKATEETETPEEVTYTPAGDKNFEPEETEDPDIVAIDGTDIFDNAGMQVDDMDIEARLEEAGVSPIAKTKYQKLCYLKFGFSSFDDRIRFDDLHKYLRVHGWANNSYTLARTRASSVKSIIDAEAVNQCDFCGMPLSGVSFDKLNDGRIRCNDCSKSAIVNVDDFRELFYRTLELMQSFYDIEYRVPVSVKTADAKTVNKGVGRLFSPSKEFASRTLGYAQRKGKNFSLIVENGSPRLATIETIVHEMTHIWQYLNWSDAMISANYGMPDKSCTERARLIVYEGMAVWSAIQYLYQIGESYYASLAEEMYSRRKDPYGVGFVLYREHYPLSKDANSLGITPFDNPVPIDPIEVKAAVLSSCTSEECKCRKAYSK